MAAWTRAYYADQNPENRTVLEQAGALPEVSVSDVPAALERILERTDVGYCEGDAAETGSLEHSKVVGVEAALEVFGTDDRFAVVTGDSKSDLRVMRRAEERGAGTAGAPEHASQSVVDHVEATDELVFNEDRAGDIFRTVFALNRWRTDL